MKHLCAGALMTAKIKGSPAAALTSPQIRLAVFLTTIPVAIALITPYVTRIAIHISAITVYVVIGVGKFRKEGLNVDFTDASPENLRAVLKTRSTELLKSI